MKMDPNGLPARRALEVAQAICERLDGAERDQPKAYAAMLVARHIISKARQHSDASSEDLPVGPVRRTQ